MNDFRLLVRGLFAQSQIVHAIILRETRTRFGEHQLGYIWALIDPLTWIAIFGGMMYITGRTTPTGPDIVAFLATGIVPYQLFLNVAKKGEAAISGNKALLFYPQVRPLDLIIARSTLEIATSVAVLAALLAGNALWREEFMMSNLLHMMLGLALASALGVGMGLTLCSLGVFSNSAGKVSSILFKPLFWTSGIFFTANDLPTFVQELLLYNPILHCVELVRDGWFPSYTALHANASYPAVWALGFVLLGMTLERVARRNVEVI